MEEDWGDKQTYLLVVVFPQPSIQLRGSFTWFHVAYYAAILLQARGLVGPVLFFFWQWWTFASGFADPNLAMTHQR